MLLTIFAIVTALIIAIGLITKNLPRIANKTDATEPRYTKASSLLTPAEQNFFAALRNAVPEAAIFPKVRVADVLTPRKKHIADFRRISQKHFDWVLCHPETYEPLLAIELDDSSHQRTKQKQNDATKDTAAKDAGLDVIRIRWSQKYNTEEIRATIAEKINAL
jgi:very-short-patch-repair endonuclease